MLAVLLVAALLPVIAPGVAHAAPRAGSVGVSDDFEAPNIAVDTWTLVDPTGRGQASIALGGLVLVPGGDSWEQDNSTRVEQSVEDDDFDLTVEVVDLPDTPYSAVGTTIAGETSWLRIGFTGTAAGPAIVAIANNDGTPTVRLNLPVEPDSTRLRVRRIGTQYLISSASATGDWRLRGSFVESFAVQRLALFGATRESLDQPLAISDFSASEPVPDRGADATGPLIHGVTTRPVGGDLLVTFFTDELAIGSLAVDGRAETVAGSGELTLRHEVTVPGIENGSTVAFRPLARDAAGNESEGQLEELRFSTEGLPIIDVWYGDRQSFGRNGVPQRWVNILGNVRDDDGIASLTYSVDSGPQRPLSIGPSDRRLNRPGDFNADFLFAELQPGEHSVELVATDALGNTNTRVVTVVIAPTAGLVVPYEVVWADAAGGSLNDIAQVVDGKWTVQEDGTLRTVEIGYDRVVAVGDQRWTDYEMEFPVVIHEVSEAGYSPIDVRPNMTLTVGWSGHHISDGTQPPWYYWPSTGIAGLHWETLEDVRMKVEGNGGIPSQSTGAIGLPLDTKIWLRVRVERLEEGPRISMKAWADGSEAPSEWVVSVIDDDDTFTGSVAIVAHHVDVSIGNVKFELLGP